MPQLWSFPDIGAVEDRAQSPLREEELAQSSLYLGEILRTTRDCIQLLDFEGRLLSMNPEGQERLGIDDFSRFQGAVWADLWTGSGHASAKRAVQDAVAGTRSRFEGSFRTLRGEDTWWDVTVAQLPAGEGKPPRLLVISREITERKRVEADLERQRSQLQLVVDNVPALMAYVDNSGAYRWINRVYEDWYGLSTTNVVGRSSIEVLSEHIGQEYADQLRPRLTEVLAGNPVSFEADQLFRGKKRKLSLSYTPDRDAVGQVRGAIVLVTDVTHQHEIAETLAASARKFQTLTEALPSVVVWTSDPNGQFEYLSERFRTVTGQEPAFGEGSGWERVVHPEDLAIVGPLWQAAVESGMLFESRYRILQRDGSYRWFLVRGLPERNESSEIVRWIGVSTDVHDQVETEQALRASEISYRLLFENNPHPMWTYDPATLDFTSVNHAAVRMYGYSANEFLSMRLTDIRPKEDIPELIASIAEAVRHTRTFRHRRKDGSVFFVEVFSHELPSDAGPSSRLALVSDVTERVRLHQELTRLAEHDPLTGLPNRLVFSRISEQAILRAKANGSRVAFVALDFDRFKQVNDTFGHEAGDHFLAGAAHRLRSVLRPSDTLTRAGGDEFLAVVEDLNSTEEGMRIAGDLVSALRDKVSVLGLELQSSISVGLAFFPDDGQDLADLQRCADHALYAAKQSGRSCTRRFSHAHTLGLREAMQIEQGLRTAIEDGRLQLHYQPIVSPDRRIRTLEALLRFQHQTLGEIPPARFIPVAEQSGLIIPIGEWVLSEACRQIASWRQEGRSVVPVSINVSALQFSRGDLARQIKSVLDRTGVAASLLQVELTESVLMANVEESLQYLRELKETGVSLAMDDFGTGYSSLSYLHDFPLDTLKIDRSFVQRITSEGEGKPIVRAIVQLAKSLGLQVVAEGVETPDQRDELVRLDCQLLQGYLFARPANATATGNLLG